MHQSLDSRRKKLLFRSVRRGTKESDMVIGGFAERHLAELDDDQLDRLETLLDCNDQELLGWISGTRQVPPEYESDVLKLLRRFKNSISNH